MPEAQAINVVLSSALWDVVILRFWSALAVKWPSPCYSLRDLEEALEMGVDWSLREGYAWAEDKEHCEEYGMMLQADPNKVSARAKKRGLPQVTLTLEGKRSFFSCFGGGWRKKSVFHVWKSIAPDFFRVHERNTNLFMLHSYSFKKLSGACRYS